MIGKRWYQQHYGVDVRVGWNPDSFGYNWQLPQIYKKSGVDYFVTQKMSWNDTNQLPLKLFWWESPDGSKVLTYFPRGYANRDVGPMRLSANMAQARQQAPGMTEMLDLYGVGDHGGGPTRVILDQASRWMQPGKVAPQMHFGTANAYFASVEKQIGKDSPVWNYRESGAGLSRARSTTGIHCHPNLEGRTLPRDTPWRVHYAGESEAQHPPGATGNAERGEVCFTRLAGW